MSDDILQKAMVFAVLKHKDQKDDYGKDYVKSHIFQVVNILEQVTDDKELLAAAYLHDVLEDTDTKYEEIAREFGTTIADLVMEVTHEGKKDNKGYWFSRLHSKRGIMLKFADRLSNLSRMDCWPEKRQQQYLKRSKFWKSE